MTVTISDKAHALLVIDRDIRAKSIQLDELQAAIIILQEQRERVYGEVRQLEHAAQKILLSGGRR